MNQEEKNHDAQENKIENEATESNVENNTEQQELSPLEKITAEKTELQDKYLRLVAEFDNYKKRNAKERIELIMTANKETVISLLDVLDDCERASEQFINETNIKNIIEGSNLVFSKLKKILENKGLKKMEALNTEFNLEQHEAITEIEAGEDKKNKVVDIILDGYLLNDKIVRFAKVVVGKSN